MLFPSLSLHFILPSLITIIWFSWNCIPYSIHKRYFSTTTVKFFMIICNIRYVWKCDLYFIIVIPCFIIFAIDIIPQDIETYNTRLFKEEKDGHVTYILRIASVAKTGEFKCRMLTKTWNKEICLVLQPYIALDLVCLLLVKSTSWSFTIDAKVPRPSKGPVDFVISSLSPPLPLPRGYKKFYLVVKHDCA